MPDTHPFNQQPPPPIAVESAEPGKIDQAPMQGMHSMATRPKGANPFAKGIRQNRLYWIIGGVVGALIIAGGLTYYFLTTNKGGVLLEGVQPNEVTLTLNGKSVKGVAQKDGTFITAFPGQYRLQIAREGYSAITEDIILGKKQTLNLRPVFTLLPKQEGDATVGNIQFVRASIDGKYVFFLGDNQHTIYRMSVADRVPIPLTNQPLTNVKDIEWSRNPDIALILEQSGTFLQEVPSFDFITQNSIRVAGSEVVGGVWDPTSADRLAIAYSSPSGEHSLIFTNRAFTTLDRKADISQFTNPKLVWSLDGNAIALINRGSDQSQNNVWVYSTSDGTMHQLTTSGSVTDASFSPDSHAMMYEDSKGIHLISLSNGTVSNDPIPGHVSQAAWKDGSSFFLPDSSNKNLALYTLDGKRQSLAFTFADISEVKGMDYFPATKILIFFTGNAIYTVNVGI